MTAPNDPDPVSEAEGRSTSLLEEWTYNLVVLSFYLPVAVGCLAYIEWSGGRFALETRTIGEEPLMSLAVGFCAAVPVIGASWWAADRIPSLRRLGRSLARMTGRLSFVSALIVSAAAAIGEELLFRAVLQEQLGAPVGIVLFAAAHVPFERDLWPWPLLALGAGTLFAGLYEVTGAVLAPTVAHFLINAVNLRWLTMRFGAPDSAT